MRSYDKRHRIPGNTCHAVCRKIEYPKAGNFCQVANPVDRNSKWCLNEANRPAQAGPFPKESEKGNSDVLISALMSDYRIMD